jgi:hypothetical protein
MWQYLDNKVIKQVHNSANFSEQFFIQICKKITTRYNLLHSTHYFDPYSAVFDKSSSIHKGCAVTEVTAQPL